MSLHSSLPAAGANDDTADLQKEFRSIIMLNTLVTAVNTGGDPTLSNRSEPYQEPSDRNLPTHSRLLNAVATILARNIEVVAVTVHYPFSHQPPFSSEDRQDSYPLLVIKQSPRRVGLPGKHEAHSGITAAAHTDHQNKFVEQKDSIDCRLDNVGESHLRSVQSGSWDNLLSIPGTDPFQNHVATVEEYLVQYKRVPDKKAYFFNFTRYIVTQSWKKMHRRIFHWCSLAFIDFLTRMEEPTLRGMFLARSSSIPPPKSNDTKLALLLVGMQRKGQIASLIMDNCPSKESRSQLTSLLSVFADIVRKKENKELSEVPEGTGAYTEATCYEFHQLLVASLMAYANALGALSEAECNWQNHPGTEAMKMRESCAQRVWQCTYLLWRIAYSQILHQHLVLLGKGFWLHQPIDSQKALSVAELGLSTGLCDLAGKDGADEDADREVDEEMQCIREMYTPGQRSASMFASWIRLLVSHWVALEIVSSFCAQTSADRLDIKIYLLAVEPRSDNTEMEYWETTVRKLAIQSPHPFAGQFGSSNIPTSPTTFNPEVAIDLLKQQVDKYAAVKSSNAIFHAFRATGDNSNQYKPEFYGDVHCEAVLASFVKYANVVMDSNTGRGIGARELIQNSNKTIIALSKPCCPVCWELLGVVAGDEFDVHGHHSIISPVRLPPWLPRDIMEQMVARFKHTLRQEILAMIQRVSRRPSLQSTSYLFDIASEDSGSFSDLGFPTVTNFTTGHSMDDSSSC